MRLLELEEAYCEQLRKGPECLKSHYNKVVEAINSGCRNNEITKAVLTRMREFYKAEDNEKDFLNYKVKQPAAYFFEKTVLFYTKACMEAMHGGYEVAGQEKIKIKNGEDLVPDIIVKDKDKNIVSAIECKTQLGYARHLWEKNFRKRENSLRSVSPNAKMFLLVLTGENWPLDKFQGSGQYGKKYFCLTNLWPSCLSDPVKDDQILTPVEDLLKNLL